MRWTVSRLSLLLALAFALGALSVSLRAWSYIGFEQLPVTGSVTVMTPTKITPPGQAQAQSAGCRLETAQVRWTIDGTTPTSTVGTLLEVGDWLPISGHDALVKFQAIRTGSTSGQLDCTYAAP